MEYLGCYFQVSSSSDQREDEVNLSNFIDDDFQINNNKPSDYYGFTNITRTVSDAEEDAFSVFDVDDFLNEFGPDF